MNRYSATAIIPVFNEQKTVGGVVKTVLESGLFDQVIAVNDGSTDQTPDILESFGTKIQVINFAKNKGKGYALMAGVKKSTKDVVVFLDADSTNLSRKHLLALTTPFERGKTRVVVGFERNDIASPGFLQGERAYFRQDLLPYLASMRCTRFGIELFLEGLRRKKKWPAKHVHLKGIKKLLKFDKTGLTQQTLKNYLQEALEIAQVAARIGKKTAEEKIILERKILKKVLKNYLKTSKKMINKILQSSKNLKKLKELLKDVLVS